jgi:hypothetical protein
MPDYLGTSVFVAFDGDHIGREVGRASLADDVEGLRKLSQAIEKGNQLWGSWALASMGTVVSLGGDEGRVEVPADKLGDIPDLRAQYHSAVGASVTVGVGMTLSEADKALLYGKMHGGDQVVFFTEDVDQEIQELIERQDKRSEVDKIADEYLNKAEAPGQAQPQVSAASASMSQGQQARQTVGQGAATQMDAAPPPPPAGETSMEQRLHAHAQKQKKQDTATMAVQQQQSGREALKQQVVKVLKQVKAAAPMLEEVKSTAPDAYKAVLGAVQAMVAMAKQLDPNSQNAPDGDAGAQKGDSRVQDNAPEGSKSPDGVKKAELPMPDPGPAHHELDLPVGSTRDGRIKVRHADGSSTWVEVRAGMVMSQDGHAISARNPGGK